MSTILKNWPTDIPGEKLTWFFTQWLDSTGAPEFKNKYTIYRTNKGFRVVGEIQQDLDLFRMPVEIKIDTDGKTETKKVDVVGTNSAMRLRLLASRGLSSSIPTTTC